LIVSIYGALIRAVDIIFDGPSRCRAVLHAGLSVIVSMVAWVHRAVLDTSSVESVLECHDRRRRTYCI